MAAPPASSSYEAAAAAAWGGEDAAAAVPDADAPLDLLDNNKGQHNRHCSQTFDLLAKAAAAALAQ